MRIKFIIPILLCLPLMYNCSGEQNLNGALMVNPRGHIEITPTQGEAYVFNAGMVGSPKALLLEGASIQTGNESYVDLQFQTRVSLRVGPNSKLKLRESKIVLRDNESRVLLDLQSGRLFSRSDRLESNSRIVVRTPTVVAAVRGTEFLIIEEDQSELMVNGGAV
ncbi:MAG: FecR domain-containing protein [Leptospiraceae bacterium]|nr:FecR domain-containing protein [Leptospiraceae bacterium]